ncbi:membrane-bound transcription factor site-2 protease-like [Rhopilema esculentum]|uniref:membrane-bound transcription factor site-2 protease-like n=1 Tax=Rhopilema esculentum TaxID=499914 RepID=UPI0031D25FB5
MIPTIGIVFVIVFWLIVFLTDRILSSRRFVAQYRKLLEKTGITVSFLQIKSYTKYFNKWFQQIGKIHGPLMQLWFNGGVIFGGFAMVFSVYILSKMLYKNMTEEKPEQMLTPVIPGVNIPWQHLIYYFLTLAVGGTLHEMGHAIAAARENVRVLGFGWFILPIFCGAYVELQTDHLQVISAFRQLRIYCAGVWHNCISALIAAGLFFVLPSIYLLFYSTEGGVVVSDVYKESVVFETLPRGSVITTINSCLVKTVPSFVTCVNDASQKGNIGYCHSMNAIIRRNTSTQHLSWNGHEPECCGKDSPSKFCFSHTIDSVLTHSCLPARKFVVNDSPCYKNSDCSDPKAGICVVPFTSKENRFLKLTHTLGQDVLFVGNPYELLAHVSVSDYVPKSSFIPLDIPDYIQTLLVYFASLSGALAILNMIPCYCLDGQWTLLAFMEYFLKRLVKSEVVRIAMYHVTLLLGTGLLLLNLVFGLWNLRGQGILSSVPQSGDSSS